MSDLSLLCFCLGIKVRQDATGIILRQTDYTKRILELGEMVGCNLASTPMEKIRHSRYSTREKVDSTYFRRPVDNLQYLVHTRPNLASAVGCMS